VDVQYVTVKRRGGPNRDNVADAEALSALLGAWRMNGQVCGREWPIASTPDCLSTTVLCPESGSLDSRWNRHHVSQALARLEEAGLDVSCRSLGADPGSASACECTLPSGYMLFTTFLSLESPVRCLDCFQPVALHRFEPTDSDEYYGVIGWQSDYQSCDSLQMNCSVLERAATREISAVDSALSRRGRALCDALSESSGRPFHYYLHRSGGRSHRSEIERRCPGCGGEWTMAERLHLFDFKCDSCRLLSNISFSLR
jgi:predicted  nucleic acid-binding Zn ribbon protein